MLDKLTIEGHYGMPWLPYLRERQWSAHRLKLDVADISWLNWHHAFLRDNAEEKTHETICESEKYTLETFTEYQEETKDPIPWNM